MASFFQHEARAKINLSLRVVRRRQDGYHDLDSLMARLDLADLLSLDLEKSKNSDKLIVNNFLPCALPLDFEGPGNLALKALAAYRARQQWPASGVLISLDKRIPFGAGLGGGSADCASVLLMLNRAAPRPLPPGELAALGLSLGADVPFCLDGRPLARAEGLGERLSPPPSWAETWLGRKLLLIKPGFELSTAEVFKKLGLTKAAVNNTLGPISGQGEKAGNGACVQCAVAGSHFPGDCRPEPRPGDNDLLAPAMQLAPALAETLKFITWLKPLAWGLSGSGPTFWAYGSRLTADALAGQRHNWWVREAAIDAGPSL